jgi:hypothetical protein
MGSKIRVLSEVEGQIRVLSGVEGQIQGPERSRRTDTGPERSRRTDTGIERSRDAVHACAFTLNNLFDLQLLVVRGTKPLIPTPIFLPPTSDFLLLMLI